ncbi:MAG: flagellar biosynthesis protein FlhF [Planctomycetaceae bacterium]
MSDIRTFCARNMQEALDRVRKELGSDAVILHTKQVTQRRFLPWGRPKQQVEITAGLGINLGRRPPAKPKTPLVRSAGPARDTPSAIAASRAESLAEQLARAMNGADTLSLGGAATRIARAPVDRAAPPTANPAANPTPKFPGAAAESANTTERFAAAPAPVATASASAPPHVELGEKLDAIHRLLENLGRTSHARGGDELPGELFELYAELIDAEVEDDLARDLVFRLRKHAAPEQLRDPQAARAVLAAMVEAEIACAEPIRPVPGRRKVVGLVGPTGVGKTTTIAKLAANFRLRDDVRMGLVTVDTYRVAAVEQLRTYAEIIDLPMKVVTSPPEMRRALDELSGLDLVLIDTAGRSPRDELQINELRSLLSEAEVDDVHLVLSLTSSLKSLRATAEKFASVGTNSLILTKLDEAAGMGSALSLCRSLRLPISYVTTGQDVPDDIEPANAPRLARLVLGREKIGG